MSTDDRISYIALEKGTPVLSAARAELGHVEHVLSEPQLDLFDGIVISTDKGIKFVDANQITTITNASVQTTIERETDLPEPDGAPIFTADGLQDVGGSLTAHLGRLFRREHWKLRS